MDSILTIAEERFAPVRSDHHSQGVAWGAVSGGAFVIAAVALIMLALGAGFGLSTVSPWSDVGASASAAGTMAIVWLIATELISCALGGYLVGRLRTKWMAVHTDEVYFRDTANGFLAWAVAVIITVAFLGSAAASMVGKRDVAEQGKPASNASSYFVDRLFRGAPATIDTSTQAEAGRVLANVLLLKDSTGADQAYLGTMVAAKTGITPNDANQRVAQVVSDAKQAEDTARQAASHLLLWIFLALLIGAFSASYAATIGGRQRDHVMNVV